MELVKLGKRIRNELVRNPKKTAILAVICLVALYFWAPLIRGWIPGGKTKTVAKAAPATQVAATEAETPPAESSKALAKADAAFRWDKILALQSRDPLMASASLVGGQRNPFGISSEARAALAAQDDEPDVATSLESAKPPVEATPSELGLVLKGTLVGPRGKAATLGTRTYLEGSIVSVGGPAPAGMNASETGQVEFTLARVQKNQVVLTRGDKSFTLVFPRANLSPGESIVRTAVSDGDK